MSTVRKSYTEEFKREAVRLAKERGNIRAAARDLGVSDTSLENWKKQLEQTPENAFPGNGNPTRSRDRSTPARTQTRQGGERNPKKGCGYLHCPPPVRYQFIKEHQEQFSSVGAVPGDAGWSSGFYAWRTRPKSDACRSTTKH